MDIGIGLPATVPGVQRDDLLEWSRRAERRGFSSLGVIDRIVYPNLEPLVSLAAAAAVTERIRLVTDILIVPYRVNAALVAKQALSVDAIAGGGRLVLGVAIGARGDDYQASGVPESDRGQRMDDMLEEIRRVWSGEERGTAGPVGPPVVGSGPQMLVGGMVDATVRRTVRHGDGWTMGGGTPDDFRGMAEKVRAAWSEAGRDGEPRLMALCYFALGDGAKEAADRYLHDYYAFLGDIADAIADSAATDADTVRSYRDAFADAGADELICFPSSTDPEQVDLLADAVL
jgi:alkanesulfonate monooxygenase SsuD/methylene tetrahydromethanopterin reductase-like flavin-dependent oxidoreductase (luciferase family)